MAPHSSVATPHSAPSAPQVGGGQGPQRNEASQRSEGAHWPQESMPPHPSDGAPQVDASWAHVFGVQHAPAKQGQAFPQAPQ